MAFRPIRRERKEMSVGAVWVPRRAEAVRPRGLRLGTGWAPSMPGTGQPGLQQVVEKCLCLQSVLPLSCRHVSTFQTH